MRHLLLASATATLFFATSASADILADTAADIIVTGSRNISRTDANTMAPVDVISADAVQRNVSDDLSDVLARLTPSFNVQRLPANDGLAFVRPARLRNLSPDHTLVLVNGRRFHRSALLSTAQAADLAQIPNFSIKRIEVLRDGAAAQYGSDAIAGVVNIIMDDSAGFSGFGQFSEYYEGDGAQYQTGIRAGVKFGDGGFFNATAEYSDANATSRTRQRPDAIAFQEANPHLDVPNPVQRWGQPDVNSLRAAFNTAAPLADAATAYAFGTFSWGDGLTDFNWRNPVGTGNVYAPSAAFPDWDVHSLYPTGFTPRFGSSWSDHQLVGGFRGDPSDSFRYDVSVSHGQNRIKYTIGESINASMGPASPTHFYLGALEQREFNINADFVYRADIGLAEPLNIAFGAERRLETYSVEAGDPASYKVGPGAATGLAANSNGFPGYSSDQAGKWDQESYAGYLDIEAQPLPGWTVGGALRYEDYSAFGDTLNYKLSSRVELAEGLALRGTWSTGFRAPSPAQTYTSRTSQGLDTESLRIFTSGRLALTDPLAIALGAETLKPEKSKSLAAGLSFRTGGLTATVDVYQIKVRDRFSTSPSFQVPAEFENPMGYTRVNYFTNDYDTRTRGIDVVLGWGQQVGPGTLNMSLAYNYNQTKATGGRIADQSADQKRIFEGSRPKHNATGTIGYGIGDLTLTAHGRYYGKWTDNSGNATGEIFQDFGSMMLFDLAVDYQVTDNIKLRVGAENIFDKYPDEATNQAVRGLIYSRNAPYDTDGGQYYVRVGFEF
ncbi:MAG: TonB-dependent receptor [Sphingomonadaceae bacterium]